MEAKRSASRLSWSFAVCYLSFASRDGAFNPALGRIGRQKKCVLVGAAERSEVNQQAMQIWHSQTDSVNFRASGQRSFSHFVQGSLNRRALFRAECRQHRRGELSWRRRPILCNALPNPFFGLDLDTADLRILIEKVRGQFHHKWLGFHAQCFVGEYVNRILHRIYLDYLSVIPS